MAAMTGIIALFAASHVKATIFRSNHFRGHDFGSGTMIPEDRDSLIGASCEIGSATNCRDADKEKVSVFNVYGAEQDAIAMFMNPITAPPDAENVQNLFKVFSKATVNGETGRMSVDGKVEEKTFTVWGKWKLPNTTTQGSWFVDVYVPMKSMNFTDVVWTDLTTGKFPGDADVQTDITGRIAAACTAISSLDIGDCSESGVGDITAFLGWSNDYPQERDKLKNVHFNAKIGVSCPSGKQRDENILFSTAFGSDGAWGIPAYLGLDLGFEHSFQLGGSVDFLYLFDHESTYRMKTNTYQTDYLLHSQGTATKNHGATWNFNVYGALAPKENKGLSASVGYRYIKHDEDELTPTSDSFDSTTVNTANDLKEWASHDILISAQYDASYKNSDKRITPLIDIFAKIPITGKRVVSGYTFGGSLSITF